MTTSYADWFSLPVPGPSETLMDDIKAYRMALQQCHAQLQARFAQGGNAAELVGALTWSIDALLRNAWSSHIQAHETLSLVAVGGYGRRELLPGSDIDLMILLPDNSEDCHYEEEIQQFLTFLWDIGLEVGHSVRTPQECVDQAQQDVTVITNLVEARLLAGNEPLFDTMTRLTGPDHIWSCKTFFAAKLEEQKIRHAKFHDSSYKLEPNIKESPGGLRDIHMVGWVAKRHFGAERLEELVTHGFLSDDEYQNLMEGQSFLWKVRFALHTHTGRREDRLLFDHQRPLAQMLGYHDSEHQQAVEIFMRDYFRNVMELNRLNEVLLQLFREVILHAEESVEPVPINKRFQAIKGFLEVKYPSVFEHYPFALLEVFLILQQHPELEGIRASTIRLIRSHAEFIDDEFRHDVRCRSLFMEIFRQPIGLTHTLRKMNRYGVLAAYIPAFAKVVGQMQFDLFHIYTVDEHTLFLVRNLRRFTVEKFSHEFPLCSKVIQTIPKPELLYLAGLFHDIAKGRGGDHSTLGAEDAYEFCIAHDLSEYDAQLVAWIVRNHLVMSTTAQRRDISDPAVIHEFAKRMENPVRLDYLYLLTVADIRATNPELWNSWKEALLRELFTQTKRAFRRGLEDPMGAGEQTRITQTDAIGLLEKRGFSPSRIQELWETLDADYFLRHTADEIAWQAGAILEHDTESALVIMRTLPEGGSTEIFVHTPTSPTLFTAFTALLEQLGLTIMDARIFTSSTHFAFDTYVVMERDGSAIQGDYRKQEIQMALHKALQTNPPQVLRVTRRAPRQHQHFKISTRVRFPKDEPSERTMVEIVTTDRPGLLSTVGQVFNDCTISLENARIATFGSRAEDVFYVLNEDGSLLDEDQCKHLQAKLVERLDQ